MAKKIVKWQSIDGRFYDTEEAADRQDMIVDARQEMRAILKGLMDTHMNLIDPNKLLAELLAKDSQLLAKANQYQQNYFKKA